MLTLISGDEPSMTRVCDEPVADCGLKRRLDCLEIDGSLPSRVEILLPEAEASSFADGLRGRLGDPSLPHHVIDLVRDEYRSGWAIVAVIGHRRATSAAVILYGERMAAA